MNPLYKNPKDITIIRRTSDNKEFEEYPLTLIPQSALVTDPINDVICVPLCSLIVGFAYSASFVFSSSYANTSSVAVKAISSSYADTSSFCTDTASYSLSSSHALVSDLAITTSYAFAALSASNAFSASYAQSSSYGTNFLAPRVTSSYVSASNIITAQQFVGTFGNFTQITASNIQVSGLAVETASLALLALTSISSSASLVAVSASNAAFANEATLADMTVGLNTLNAVPMPNNQIVFGTPAPAPYNNPSVFIGAATTNESHPHATIAVNNKLYGAGWDGNLFVFNDPDGNISDVTTSSFIAGNFVSAVTYAPSTGFLYFINGSSTLSGTGSIVRVDPDNIVTGQHVLIGGLPGGGTLAPIITDDTYLYTLTNSKIWKWDLNGNLVQTASAVSASVTIGGAHSSAISDDNQWVYFGIANPGMIFKVLASNLANNTCSAQMIDNFPNCCFTAALTDDLAYLNGYLWNSNDGVDGVVYRVDGQTLDVQHASYPSPYNSFGCYADGINAYALQGIELLVYPNGNINNGPVRFALGGGNINEMWQTDGGRYVFTNWQTTTVDFYYIPMVKLGINKIPNQPLDVAGIINSDTQLQAPNISCSNNILFNNGTFNGTLTYGANNTSIRGGQMVVSQSLIKAPVISGSAVRLGRPDNFYVSSSFGASGSIAITRSLGTLLQDGMYHITIAGTIGYWGGYTEVTQPNWQFKHTDRIGTYNLPPHSASLVSVTNANYNKAYFFSDEYLFQGVAGSTVESYVFAPSASSTPFTASVLLTSTLTQILSGSVTGSL